MRLEVDGHPAYAYTGGRPFDAARPTVAFVHGAQHDHSVWILQSRSLAHHGFSVLAIDLPGHADGHIGLFWQDETGPTLYATDATWSIKALLEDRTPAISRKLVFDDQNAGRHTENLIRAFADAGGRVLLCHDWVAR